MYVVVVVFSIVLDRSTGTVIAHSAVVPVCCRCNKPYGDVRVAVVVAHSRSVCVGVWGSGWLVVVHAATYTHARTSTGTVRACTSQFLTLIDELWV